MTLVHDEVHARLHGLLLGFSEQPIDGFRASMTVEVLQPLLRECEALSHMAEGVASEMVRLAETLDELAAWGTGGAA